MNTTMADVSQLNLKEFDPIDFDNYEDGKAKSYAPPVEGKYWGKAPIITDDNFGPTAQGYLKVKVDPIEIVNSEVPGANGYAVRFTSFSAKKYSTRNGSQALDFLRACGIAARPKNNDELKGALKMCSGRTFQFTLQWEGYNKDTQESIEGADNFPVDPNNPTQRLPYVTDPLDPNKRIWANGRLRYTVSAIK